MEFTLSGSTLNLAVTPEQDQKVTVIPSSGSNMAPNAGESPKLMQKMTLHSFLRQEQRNWSQINTVAVRENMTDKLNDKSGVVVKGHIKIHDPNTGEVYVDKRNAIHYENMSIALQKVR